MIEILLCQVVLSQAEHNQPPILNSLKRALILAEPEGFVRIFVDEGEPLRLLLANFRAQLNQPGSLAEIVVFTHMLTPLFMTVLMLFVLTSFNAYLELFTTLTVLKFTCRCLPGGRNRPVDLAGRGCCRHLVLAASKNGR